MSVSTPPAPPVTVIAVGNPYRRDDGVGAAVLSLVGESLGCDARVRLLELDGEPVRMMLAWEGSSTVWIVDATSSDRPPGSIHEVDAARLREADDAWRGVGGGHALGLSEAVDLAAVLCMLPDELRVLGIEGASFDHGEGLSPAVSAAVPVAAALLVAAIRCYIRGQTPDVTPSP
ncbi:MAG TPA: hydrogenase maturation protease [Ilumatobacteraceae bacterium]|nr:hydrogenase maturation protease [Ilumatobacteraceae bacterium]